MADAMTMKYDLEVLASKESTLQTISAELLETKKALNRLKNESDAFWKGPASDKFRMQSEDIVNKVSKQKAKIDVCKQNLTDAINVYRKTEQKNEGTVNNLSTENIF